MAKLLISFSFWAMIIHPSFRIIFFRKGLYHLLTSRALSGVVQEGLSLASTKIHDSNNGIGGNEMPGEKGEEVFLDFGNNIGKCELFHEEP